MLLELDRRAAGAGAGTVEQVGLAGRIPDDGEPRRQRTAWTAALDFPPGNRRKVLGGLALVRLLGPEAELPAEQRSTWKSFERLAWAAWPQGQAAQP